MKIRNLILIVMAITLVSACKNDSFEQTETGLRYQFFTKNDGRKPKVGDIIFVHMLGVNSKDSALFDTYKMGQPFNISIMEPTFKGSLEEGFMMMAQGDSAVFLINADSLYTRTFQRPVPEYVEKGSDIKFTLKMMEIYSQEEMNKKMQKEAEEKQAAEAKAIESYKAAHADAKMETTASGLMYEVVKANPKGRAVKDGDSVSVHYTGTLLDGTVFDSSVERGEPITFPAGKGMVIPGWDEAIKLMKEGEKFKLLIPSRIAYGERGAGPKIPPFSTLLFDVELVKVK